MARSGSSRRPPIRCGSSPTRRRSEEHTSELQSLTNLVCRLLLEKKKKKQKHKLLAAKHNNDTVMKTQRRGQIMQERYHNVVSVIILCTQVTQPRTTVQSAESSQT